MERKERDRWSTEGDKGAGGNAGQGGVGEGEGNSKESRERFVIKITKSLRETPTKDGSPG